MWIHSKMYVLACMQPCIQHWKNNCQFKDHMESALSQLVCFPVLLDIHSLKLKLKKMVIKDNSEQILRSLSLKDDSKINFPLI